tara:strand:+ start:2063 stop:2815 length:753 start_codon:yes stop_codon:yes gene_type:complete
MNNPKVSIVVTFFNAEKTILETIKSIANQSFNSFEVVFVDGKSTDQSLKIVKENLHLFNEYTLISENDNGIYDGMNKGINLCKGDIVAILNADDFYYSNALEKVVEEFSDKYDIWAGTICRFNEYGEENVVNRSELPPLSASSPTIHHPAVFVKKSLYEKIGLFDLSYKISADYDFIARAVTNGATIFYSDTITTAMREGGVSDSLKFHTRKNIEHMRIGFKYINTIREKFAFTYYVCKKFSYGFYRYFR